VRRVHGRSETIASSPLQSSGGAPARDQSSRAQRRTSALAIGRQQQRDAGSAHRCFEEPPWSYRHRPLAGGRGAPTQQALGRLRVRLFSSEVERPCLRAIRGIEDWRGTPFGPTWSPPLHPGPAWRCLARQTAAGIDSPRDDRSDEQPPETAVVPGRLPPSAPLCQGPFRRAAPVASGDVAPLIVELC
jgi:hypothetical protein